jgi:hypothetical protein
MVNFKDVKAVGKLLNLRKRATERSKTDKRDEHKQNKGR